jgi:hypothetical protein
LYNEIAVKSGGWQMAEGRSIREKPLSYKYFDPLGLETRQTSVHL